MGIVNTTQSIRAPRAGNSMPDNDAENLDPAPDADNEDEEDRAGQSDDGANTAVDPA